MRLSLRTFAPLALIALLSAPAGASERGENPFQGIWCVTMTDDGTCTNIYDMRDAESFVNYIWYQDAAQRADVFGRWVRKPGKACFIQESWLRVDLEQNETVATGELGMDTFYCNELIDDRGSEIVITAPYSEDEITVTRLDALPEWAAL